MGLFRKIVGIVGVIIGLAVGYYDYLFVRTIFTASSWVSSMLHAPEAVGTLLGVVIMLFFVGMIILGLIIAVVIVIISIGFATGD